MAATRENLDGGKSSFNFEHPRERADAEANGSGFIGAQRTMSQAGAVPTRTASNAGALLERSGHHCGIEIAHIE